MKLRSRWQRIPRRIRQGIRYTFFAGVTLALMLAGWTAWTMTRRYRAEIYEPPALPPERPVALVFGAGYWPSGALSDVLRDRLDAAIELYEEGRVELLLFSGDNRVVEYNEPARMMEYALERGIPREAIVLDYAGRRTYDTCYRARDIFQVPEVVLITQRYHLPRALHTCRALGLDAVGYAADRTPYRHIRWYIVREIPALWRAWWDVHLRQPLPVLGEPLPVRAEGLTD